MAVINAGVPWWVTALIALVPAGGALLAYRQATKATKATKDVESSKVDAAAYLVAKAFYEDMLVERKSESTVQQGQITQLNAQINELQRSLNEMQSQVNIRHAEETQLREQIGRLGLELFGEQRRTRKQARRITQLETHFVSINELVPPMMTDEDPDG